MTTSHDLTTKKKIVDVIQRMPEDATIDDAINRLRLLIRVENVGMALGEPWQDFFKSFLLGRMPKNQHTGGTIHKGAAPKAALQVAAWKHTAKAGMIAGNKLGQGVSHRTAPRK